MSIVDDVIEEISYLCPASKDLGCQNGNHCSPLGGVGSECKPKNSSGLSLANSLPTIRSKYSKFHDQFGQRNNVCCGS